MNELWRGRLGEDYKSLPQNLLPPGHKKWFARDPNLDRDMAERFSQDLHNVSSGRIDNWKTGFEALAAVILMDQFTRNIYRGTARMYMFDDKALELSQQLVGSGSSDSLVPGLRCILYFPFMHSEELSVQEEGLRRFRQLVNECRELKDADELLRFMEAQERFAVAHCEVIREWGRFPHRNGNLGRANTQNEDLALKAGTIPSF